MAKNQTDATSENLNPFMQVPRGRIKKHIVVKRNTNAASVNMNHFMEAI